MCISAFSYSWVQCAAVKMCFFDTIVPPQNHVELKDKPTIQGNYKGLVVLPPTIREASIDKPQPSVSKITKISYIICLTH